jgi:hypothetical protein
MPNMSHCRFENTYEALWDCQEHIEDTNLSKEEQQARRKLVRCCKKIVEAYEAADIDEAAL